MLLENYPGAGTNLNSDTLKAHTFINSVAVVVFTKKAPLEELCIGEQT